MKPTHGAEPSTDRVRRDYRRLMRDVNPLETHRLRQAGALEAHIERVACDVNRILRGAAGVPVRSPAEAREAAWRHMVSSLPNPPAQPPSLTQCPCRCLDADNAEVHADVRRFVESARGDLRSIRRRVAAHRRRHA